MVDGAAGNAGAKHLFKTQSLSAKLHFVIVPSATFAALVFDGKGNIVSARLRMKLDDIRDADEPEPMTDEPKRARSAEGAFFRIARLMNTTMVDGARGGVDVLHPKLLDAMQETPPFAEEQIVERG